jgi:hypothetical protein
VRTERRAQAEREAFENFFRSWYETGDNLDLAAYLAPIDPNARLEDAVTGDITFTGLAQGGPDCAIDGAADFAGANALLFGKVGTPGRLWKYKHSVGSLDHGGVGEIAILAGTFYNGPQDLAAFEVLRDGVIVRRNDYHDTAQLTPADIAILHPNGVPRQSCSPSVIPGYAATASVEMREFTELLVATMKSGNVARTADLFTADALLIHRLAHQPGTPYGLYDQGNQIRGRDAIARFYEAVLPLLPDGPAVSVLDVTGGAIGGGFEWKAEGIYARQGLARDGINGVTSISLFGDRIWRMSVMFDQLQMTPQQRAAVGGALTEFFALS